MGWRVQPFVQFAGEFFSIQFSLLLQHHGWGWELWLGAGGFPPLKVFLLPFSLFVQWPCMQPAAHSPAGPWQVLSQWLSSLWLQCNWIPAWSVNTGSAQLCKVRMRTTVGCFTLTYSKTVSSMHCWSDCHGLAATKRTYCHRIRTRSSGKHGCSVFWPATHGSWSCCEKTNPIRERRPLPPPHPTQETLYTCQH